LSSSGDITKMTCVDSLGHQQAVGMWLLSLPNWLLLLGRQHPNGRNHFLFCRSRYRFAHAPIAHDSTGRQFGQVQDIGLHVFPNFTI
jgi:hypothetical protein